ncbi:hypothetical protein VO54_03703 [Elizabethkingia miricola]|nr:hypothetical protein VO54_03703 [Elizabethkingia miricola]
MDLLKARIEEFNEVITHEIDDDYTDWYGIMYIELASTEQLNELVPFFEMELPIPLQTFYQQIGGIKNRSEDYHLNIPSVSILLEELKAERNFDKRYSMGLIDAIKSSWGNSRPEFNNIPQIEIDYINANYKCIGLYRYDGQLEEHFYIYFDSRHQFGLVRYHQDEFDELWAEHLTPMLSETQADKSLEQLLIQILDCLEKGIISEFDED